tara:strand:- start:4183 stop:4818 length:636 start_codon:yes stop_codon:yes gene_type:complete
MIKTYKTCSKIPIYNYYKANLTNDFRYLIVGYDDSEDAEDLISYKNDKELSKVLKELCEEYAVLVFDKKTMRMKKMEYTLTYLVGKYNVASKIVDIYLESKMRDVLLLLNDLGFNIDLEKDVDEQIKGVIKKFKMLKNEINVKRVNLEKLSGVNEEKASPEDVVRNLDKVALSLESNLELGYNINVRKVTVERWVNLISMSEERAKRSQNI